MICGCVFVCDYVFQWNVLDCSGHTDHTSSCFSPHLAHLSHQWHIVLARDITNMRGGQPEMDLSRQLGLKCSIPGTRWSPNSQIIKKSLFMSPESNLVIWIDSWVIRDYKTSCVLCGGSPLGCNLVMCVWMSCSSSCNIRFVFFFFNQILDTIKAISLFYHSLCWWELFAKAWNHNQCVFPPVGELLQDVGDYVSEGEIWNEIHANVKDCFSGQMLILVWQTIKFVFHLICD